MCIRDRPEPGAGGTAHRTAPRGPRAEFSGRIFSLSLGLGGCTFAFLARSSRSLPPLGFWGFGLGVEIAMI
eukprot:948816-Alexandrium_andersonii.AAC.1